MLCSFYSNGQLNFKSKDFGLKNNPKSIYKVNPTNYPSDDNITLYQKFNIRGLLIKHVYAFKGFSINSDTLIYNSKNILIKKITSIEKYNHIEERRYDYLDDNKVKITLLNNSPQNSGNGKEMKESGIRINHYKDSILIETEIFSFESEYKQGKPSEKIRYKYDEKNNLIESVSFYNGDESKVIKYKNNEKGILIEKQIYMDNQIIDTVLYKNYEFDDKGNWLKRSVESKNNTSNNYSISRNISYY